ncbi:hypothetical protein FHG87_024426, partial [Trinorchestia longiramus]
AGRCWHICRLAGAGTSAGWQVLAHLQAGRCWHICRLADELCDDLADTFRLPNVPQKVLATPHTSLESLKAKLQWEWEAIPQEQIRASRDAFVNEPKDVVRNKGGFIE